MRVNGITNLILTKEELQDLYNKLPELINFEPEKPPKTGNSWYNWAMKTPKIDLECELMRYTISKDFGSNMGRAELAEGAKHRARVMAIDEEDE